MALSQRKSMCGVQVDLSVVEIYCESIKDLLSEGPGSTGLSVQQDKTFGIIVAGATKVWCIIKSLHMVGCMYDRDAICGIFCFPRQDSRLSLRTTLGQGVRCAVEDVLHEMSGSGHKVLCNLLRAFMLLHRWR